MEGDRQETRPSHWATSSHSPPERDPHVHHGAYRRQEVLCTRQKRQSRARRTAKMAESTYQTVPSAELTRNPSVRIPSLGMAS